MAMKRSVLVPLFGILAFMFLPQTSTLGGRPSIGPSLVQAQEGWKAEYDSVCSKTDVAMTLPKEELSALIDRCDKLRPKIESEEESTRKVYLRRLQLCRELYKYVLETKESR
jgi:hypothetical protein